ncbi:MAG: 4Fe-4S binding protein [Chloroflexi bacterium]|nr:4Fe-4S binding protein [Chloroflexota bacterium]
MLVDKAKCVGCANCVSVCPMGAIHIGPDRKAEINQDECVECYTCYRGLSTEHLPPFLVRSVRGVLRLFRLRFEPDPDVCPTAALTPNEITWPRLVRRAFSDPVVPHESTGTKGRGTAEVKTNDVTGRVGPGQVGFVVELGRPSVGARFREVDKVTHALADAGVTFEPNNPVTYLMSDVEAGQIRPDILNEKILSCIVESKAPLERVPAVLDAIEKVSKGLDTVVSVGVSSRCDSEGNDPLKKILEDAGYTFYRGKVNLGLGKPAKA